MSDSEDYDVPDGMYDSDYIPDDDDDEGFVRIHIHRAIIPSILTHASPNMTQAPTSIGNGDAKGKGKSIENQLSFKSLTPETLHAQMDKEVGEVVGITGVPVRTLYWLRFLRTMMMIC